MNLIYLLYAATVFLSAFLLFWIQPLLTKSVLPMLGGTPSVWNACLLFFQTMLLLGYSYSHLLSSFLGKKTQALIHAALLNAAWFLCFPIRLFDAQAPAFFDSPTLWLLFQLILTIGIPFFFLSTTSSLIQRWHDFTATPNGPSPYPLYAVSNAGTLLILLGYSFFIEPAWGIGEQLRLWSSAYAVFIVLMALSGGAMIYSSPKERKPEESKAPIPVHPMQRVEWVFLAFIPSSLLLGVTRYLSTDLASAPLLWLIPLALYMLTFVIVFSPRPPIPQRLPLQIQPLILVPPLVAIFSSIRATLWIDFPVHLVAFFINCLVCHGELAKRKPHPSRLTEFYFWIALGGVIGSVFNVLIAPLIFLTSAEYPLMLMLLIYVRHKLIPSPGMGSIRGISIILMAAMLLLCFGLISNALDLAGFIGSVSFVFLSALLGPAMLRLLKQSLPMRIAAFSILFIGSILMGLEDHALYRSRNFYGTLAISNNLDRGQRLLYSGSTLHGAQYLDGERAWLPTSYYHPSSPIGQIMERAKSQYKTPNIAVLGLGAGALAAYGTPGMRITFFELDPAMYQIAAQSGYFTFLESSLADISVILGDARVSLRTIPDHSYDLLIVDVFASDAIPAHLLTQEALALYQLKLRPSGSIAVHISNRYLDLRPLIARLAQSISMEAIANSETLTALERKKSGRVDSTWTLMAANPDTLDFYRNDPNWIRIEPNPQAPLWTDDFTNLLSVLRMPWELPE